VLSQEHAGLVPTLLLAPDSFVRGVVPVKWIQQMIATPASAAANFRVLYALLILEVWNMLFIRNRMYERPSVKIRELMAMPGDKSRSASGRN
jgi:hypothetical protein